MAVINTVDDVISLSGSNSIIGRTFVVHSDKDDLGKGDSKVSLVTGNAGEKVACGIIYLL